MPMRPSRRAAKRFDRGMGSARGLVQRLRYSGPLCFWGDALNGGERKIKQSLHPSRGHLALELFVGKRECRFHASVG